ncbi:hypothetical protein Gotur_031029 [Gossypium turneri]
MTFCSRYLEDVETRMNKPSRNVGLTDHNLAKTYLFQSYGEPIGKVEILELDDRSSRPRSRRLQHREINKLFTESFHEWLSQTVWSGKDVNDEVKWLSRGLNRVVKRYSAFLINGFRFHAKYRERLRRTQNYEIVVNSSITSYASARDSNPIEGNVEYYGLLTDIIELDYYGKWKVVLFRCDWADVNTAHPTDEGWYVVLHNIPRDLFDMGNGSRDDIDDRSETLSFSEQNLNENIPSTNKMPRRRL